MKTEVRKILIMIGINIIILFFAHLLQINILLYAAIIMFMGIVLLNNEKYFIPIMLFYLPWSPVLKISPETISFYTVVQCLYLLKFIIFNRNNYSLRILLYIIGLMVITLIAKVMFLNSFSLDYFLFFAMLLFFAIYSKKYGKSIRFSNCVLFLNLGIISACFSALYLMRFPYMLEYIDVYTWERKGLMRLSGFYKDANFYSAQIIASITCNLIILLFEEKNRILTIFFIVVLIYCGMLSVSKSFIILLLLILLLWCIIVLITSKKIKLKILVIFSIIFFSSGILFYGMFYKTIQMYFTRFEMSSDVNSLSTGRSNILENYIVFLENKPLMLIFGQGYTKILYQELNNKASHNTVIQAIYQFGLLGSIPFILWVKNISKFYRLNNYCKHNNIKNLILNFITIIGFFGPWLALDILFFNDFFYFLVLFFIIKDYISMEENNK